MKELLKAIVDKDFPIFEEIANRALAARVKVLLEGYRPIAVGKFLAESENVSRHKGGEYIFEDGTFTDISKETVRDLLEDRFEAALASALAITLAASAVGAVKEEAQTLANRPAKVATLSPHDGVEGTKVHPEFAHVQEAVDYFISASKKNFDAYVEDPEAIVEALLEAEFQLPHRAAKEALFESFRKPVSFTTVNELTEGAATWDRNHDVGIGDQVFHSGKSKSGTVTGVNSATGDLKVRVHNMGGAVTNEEWPGGSIRKVDMMKDKPNGGAVDLSKYQQ